MKFARHINAAACDSYLKDYGGKKDQMHPFGALVSDVWTDIHRIRHNVRRDEHPCQLPIHLLERIILMSTDPGDVVLDPFSGTGTTAIAAKALGRHFVGIDIDPKYQAIAEDKIAKTQPSMYNGYYVSYFLDKIQSIRDIDTTNLFPPQRTSVEKKRERAKKSGSNGHGHITAQGEKSHLATEQLPLLPESEDSKQIEPETALISSLKV